MADAPKPAAPIPSASDKPDLKAATIKVEILRDYWPKDQTVKDPNPHTTNEVRHVAARPGEFPTIVDLPQEEALDLIELGAAKQWRGDVPSRVQWDASRRVREDEERRRREGK